MSVSRLLIHTNTDFLMSYEKQRHHKWSLPTVSEAGSITDAFHLCRGDYLLYKTAADA